MGIAARASTDAFYCEYQSVAPFIVCVGGFLSSCGLLLCTHFVWGATGRRFHKFIIVSILTVFVILCMASAIAILFSFVTCLDKNVFSNFSSISADNCNLVLYYWSFAETITIIIIIFLLIGFVVIGPLLMLTCIIVYCLITC